MINILDTTVYSKIKYIVFIKVNTFQISLNVIKENFNDTHFQKSCNEEFMYLIIWFLIIVISRLLKKFILKYDQDKV